MERLRSESIPWRELAFLEILDALRIVLPPEKQADPWHPGWDAREAFEELQRSSKTPRVKLLVRSTLQGAEVSWDAKICFDG